MVGRSRTQLSDWTTTTIYMSVCVLSRFSCVQLCATPWILACQAPLSMGFFRQEYWNGLPCPPPGDLPNPEIKPVASAFQADSLPLSPPGKPMRLLVYYKSYIWTADEEAHRARPGRVPSTRASVPMEFGVPHPPGSWLFSCSPNKRLLKSC